MKNRFYYSKKQESLAGYNYVITPDGVKMQYTQWCDEPEYFCNWEDAELVFECDEEPKIEFGTIPERWNWRLL